MRSIFFMYDFLLHICGKKCVTILTLCSIFNYTFVTLAIDPNCDFYQEIILGKQYEVNSGKYPNSYQSSESCRWQYQSPPGSVIVLECQTIDIPYSQDCKYDRFAVSLTGDYNFNDAHNYCGSGTLSLVSQNNTLTVGLFASTNTLGRNFLCYLTPIQIEPLQTAAQSLNCDCGWKQSKRIVGGQKTGVNEYPSMAALIDVNIHDLYCGATIISNRYALTAAHCVANKIPSGVGLLVGDHNISSATDTPYASLYALIEFKINPNYNQKTQQNDIAIVKTQFLISMSYHVGPVCLPFRFSNYDFYAETITALGWGTAEFSGEKSNTLQGVDLSVISFEVCRSNLPDLISNKQICTYGIKKDTCLSDSGGPLFWMDVVTRRLHLVGIISFGLGCATTRPAVNTRVTSYLSWIVSVTSDAVYCIR